MELDKLLVKIEADLSSLKRGLDKAENQIGRSSKNMGGSFKRLGNQLDTLGGQVLKFGGLLAGAFGAYQIKKVVDVGMQIENLQVRLKALFGTASEGAKAFDVMVKFAGRVPFSLEDIQQASGNLAVVSKDANELAEILEITGNVASATGLDFRQTSEQIQRSFAGGIASADVFRERGVRAMLGFSAGAKVSINDTIKAFKEKFSGDGEFGNVTADFAKTLTGTLSMLQDKLFSFRKAIADEFMVELKKQFGDLDKTLANSSEEIEEFGKKIGRDLADLTSSVVTNLDKIYVAFEALLLLLTSSLIVKAINTIKNLNGATLAFLGTLALISTAKEELNEGYEEESPLMKAIIDLTHELDGDMSSLTTTTKKQKDVFADLHKLYVVLGLDINKTSNRFEEYIRKQQEASQATEEFESKFEKAFQTLVSESQEFTKIFDKATKSIGDAFGDAVVKGEDFGKSMKAIFENVLSSVVSLIVQLLVLKPLLDSIKQSLDTSSGGNFISGIFSGIGKSIGGALTFANGGYVAPNKPAIVGERGAEMIVPRTASTVIPNSQLTGGGVNITQNISFSTGIVPTVRAEVINLLPQIKQQTINAVAETRERGGSFARKFGA